MKEESAKRKNSKYCEVCVSSKINISQYLAIISVSPHCKRKICQLWPNWSARNLAKRIFYPGNWDSCWWVFCVSNNHLSPVKESFSWIQSQANVKTPFIRSTVRYASTKIKAFPKPPLLGFLASEWGLELLKPYGGWNSWGGTIWWNSDGCWNSGAGRAKSKNWCSLSAKQGRQRGKKFNFYPIRVF